MSKKRNKGNVTLNASTGAVEQVQPAAVPQAPQPAPSSVVKFTAGDIVRVTGLHSKHKDYKSGAVGEARYGRKAWLEIMALENNKENRARYADEYLLPYGRKMNGVGAQVLASGEVIVKRTVFNAERGTGSIHFQTIASLSMEKATGGVSRKLTTNEARELETIRLFKDGKITLEQFTLAMTNGGVVAKPIPDGPAVGQMAVQNIGLTPSITAPVTA